MKKRILLSAVLSSVLMLGVSASAYCQINFGALKNKVVNKVKQEASNVANKAVDNVVDQVTGNTNTNSSNTTTATSDNALVNAAQALNSGNTASSAPAQDNVFASTSPKVQPKGPKPAEVTVKSNIEDVYAAFYYYLDLMKEAVQLKDVSFLCSLDGQKASNILYKVIMSHPQKNASKTTNYSESFASYSYNQIARPVLDLIGEPVWSKNPDPYQKYLENVGWYMDKINSTDDLNIQGYHLAEALAITKLSITSSDKYMTPERLSSPEYMALAGRMEEVWADMSPEYKKHYSNLEGATSIDGAAAADARQKAQWAAEAKAVKEANLENIKNSLEPVPESKWKAGPNPTLEAQCLAVANKTQPEVKFIKAVLMSPEWQYDYQWGNPIRRRVHCWCIYKMTNGYYRAVHVSFKQMNTGGGNWGPLELYGFIDEYKYVKM